MTAWRKRAAYLIAAGTVLGVGLASRRHGAALPTFVARYAGDTLWALMVYLGLGVVVPTARTSRRAALALALSYSVEASQLYRAPWIDALRQTAIGGLVLGYGFLWSDIACYTIGVSLGAALDVIATRSKRAST